MSTVARKIKVRGKTRTYMRTMLVRAVAPQRAVTKIIKKPMGKAEHARAYRNHFALNLGQGVRDSVLFARDIAYHVKNIANDAYYGVTPPQWSHTKRQVRRMARGSFLDWYRRGRR